MAEIRQGYLDDYTQITSGNVGIGTSISNEKLEIIGGTTAQELDVTGISTFTHVSGFIKKHTDYTDNIDFDAGDSGTLSGEIVVGAGLTMTVGTAATASQGTVDALKVYDMFQPPSGTTNQRPPAKTGALFYNFDFKTIEFFDGSSWRQVDNTTTSGRGVFAGGGTPTHLTSIDFINIQSRGNSESFGSLSAGRRLMGGLGNNSRGIYGGGIDSGNSYLDVMEYITIASTGGAIDFGNLTATNLGLNALASSTRGVFTGGYRPAPTKAIDVIQYVEISTLGDALDFGDLNFPRYQPGACSSPTRGVVAAGQANPANLTHIDFFTIASKGNALHFGDLGSDAYGGSSGASSTRGIFGGFNDDLKHIHYITIASTGNSIYFGDLRTSFSSCASGTVSSQTRAVIAGGRNPSNVNTIESVEIATTGNAVDFGERTIESQQFGGLSDSHGGLGGF